VIIEEINMVYDNPMAYVSTLWSKLLYGDQPAGWDIAGTKESVRKIDREKLASYMSSHYVAQNTIVCIAGNFPGTRAINEVKKSFAEIKNTKSGGKEKVVERQTRPELLVHFKETDQTHLCLGARGYNVFHPKRYAQDVLSIILGGMMSSRLFIEVRENLGLAYYVRTEAEANSDTGFLATRAGVDNKNVEKAITTILKEYRKIAREKIADGELKKAKDYIKGKTALVLESSDDLASFYGVQELLEKKILTPKEIYAKIDKVSFHDVMAVAQDIFQEKNLNLALVGPFKDKSLFEKILKL